MSFRTLVAALAAAASLAAAACTSAPAPGSRVGPAMVAASRVGPVLADSHGMTLYTHQDDAGGVPICYGRCAKSWPPFLAGAGAQPTDGFTLAPRTDGAMQWSYGGKPLYLWERDKRAGDVTGDGYGDVWHAARL